jgi:hypothetical protein
MMLRTCQRLPWFNLSDSGVVMVLHRADGVRSLEGFRILDGAVLVDGAPAVA